MEDEFDLSIYIAAALERWYWIVGAGLLAAIVALAATFLVSPKYEATALVVIAETRQRVQFDPRIETLTESQPLNAYPELALSDEVVTNLMQLVALDDVMSITDFRKLLSAEAGNDPTLLYLKVQYENPEIAADLANGWAAFFVDWANEIYGFQGGEQLRFYENQLAIAATELAVAETALADFQSQNNLSALSSELAALEKTQANYLQQQQSFSLLLEDVAALQGKLSLQEGQSPASAADQVTSLLLQLKAFNVSVESSDEVATTAPLPIQLQIDGTLVSPAATAQEYITLLDLLRQVLSQRLNGIDDTVLALQPRILSLQQQKQQAELNMASVLRDYEIAQETLVAVARKVEEERITSQDSSSGVRLASATAIPDEPVSPRKLLITAVAALLGIVVGISGVMVRALPGARAES